MRTAGMVKEAHEMAKKSLKLKEECETVTKTANLAEEKAKLFVEHISSSLKTIAADPTEAAADAEEVSDKATVQSEETFVNASTALGAAKEVYQTSQNVNVGSVLVGIGETNMTKIASKAVDDSEISHKSAIAAYTAAKDAEAAAERAYEAIETLDAAVAAAGMNKAKKGHSRSYRDADVHEIHIKLLLLLLLLLFSVLGCMTVC
ncbi:hypothetical protein LSM04_007346 [Trypanosoma melophagium]|nr:hypothetical protein LSM04_007346 [Trypanosoma melophagium]